MDTASIVAAVVSAVAATVSFLALWLKKSLTDRIVALEKAHAAAMLEVRSLNEYIRDKLQSLIIATEAREEQAKMREVEFVRIARELMAMRSEAETRASHRDSALIDALPTDASKKTTETLVAHRAKVKDRRTTRKGKGRRK